MLDENVSRSEAGLPGIGIQAASIDITPERPNALGGYAYSRSWNRVEDRLEANGVAFDDGERRLYVIALDTLYIGREVQSLLGDLAVKRSPDRPAEVLAAASHTHFAPMLDRSKPRLGIVDSDYLDALSDKLEILFDRLDAAPPLPAWVESHCGAADFSVNRRLDAPHRTWNNGFRAPREVFLAPNPEGYVDRRLRIRLFADEAGQARAAIAHFGCHPSSFPDHHAITPDYVGAIRAAVRETAGANIPVAFLQGCAGDVRATIVGGPTPLGLLRTLKMGPHFPPASLDKWRAWRRSVQDCARAVLAAPAASHPLRGKLATGHLAFPLSALREIETDLDFELGYYEIGDDIQIVSMNAEPLAKWTLSFPPNVLLTGYVGDCFGYLPVASEIVRGGYEVHGHESCFGLPAGAWRPDFETVVLDSAASLLRRDHAGEAAAR
jgi:hypothetical protein